jgi:VWFA-related protein
MRGLALVFAVVGVASTVSVGQQAPAPSQATPLFRTGVTHVVVDVVVTGKDDVPVTDLRQEDFEITENGRPQTIADFEHVSIPIAHRAIDVDAPPQPPSDVAANGQSARASRAIVIFVDDPSLTAALFCDDCPDVMVALKEALTRFLRSLTPDDQVAIVWESRSDISQDFTNDIPRLIAAVNARKAGMGLRPVGPAWRQTIISLDFTIAALAGSHYARRAIVYVGADACSPGVTSSLQGDACRDMYAKARRADVPIYTLDPRVNPPGAPDSMAELALNTGGLYFLRQSHPTDAVDTILTDNGSFYSLGFYPEPLVRDGKYHEIKVTVKRPGLHVRSREGYLAETASKPPSTPTRDMTSTLGAGVDDPSLPIRAFVAPLVPAPHATRALVTIELQYPLPEGDARALDDELRVGILALTPDGKIKASFQRPIHFTGTWKPNARGTFVIDEIIDLPSEALKLRVGVTSAALGKSGTAHIDVNVPKFETGDLQLSPIVLGASDDSLDAATGLDTIRPLVPFQPTTARTFEARDTLRVFGRVYWRATDSTIDAELTITGVTPAAPHHLTIRGESLSPGRRQGTIDVTVPLAGLAPGSYVLHLETRLSSNKSSRRDVPFVVR